MKRNPLRILAALVPLISPLASADGDSHTAISWPEGAEPPIEKAISIKKDAQKQDMTMRTKNGTAGIAFAKCMEDLLVVLADTKIEPMLLDAEGRDLKAKIALWVLDRQRRPAEYARIAELHVNAPEGREALARFYRRGKPGPDNLPRPLPRFLNPHRVGKEDAVESNRWILEYFYFAPPTGREFVENTARYVLGRALGEIGNEKSLNFLRAQVTHFTKSQVSEITGVRIRLRNPPNGGPFNRNRNVISAQ